MSRKLYPPNIGGTIPAFCGTVITVPFSMNKAVGRGDIGGFALKIKTINGEVKGLSKVTNSNAGLSSSPAGYNLEKFEVKFDVSDIDFSIGQYYKLQLAYIAADEDQTIGYYSTVGVIKFTTEPQVYIDGLKFGHINMHSYSYTGVYSQLGGDTTEKMYSTRFEVFNGDKKSISDTGWVLHNTSEDDLNYEQHEVFTLTKDLELDESYYIQFSVRTTNNLEIKTTKYRIMQRRSITPEIQAILYAENNFDNGYINVQIIDEKDDVISGKFLVSRASDKNGWMWEEFRRFDLRAVVPEEWSFKDCTVEQGVNYRYSLQQYNDYDIYSDRIISNDVYADFEDAFLYDGERQLKIRFNPQVSSFQTNILESKTETIGSKYPFITRNGKVAYKELPISGLISYQMDEAELFMSRDELGIEVFETSPTSENITAERIFKTNVLNWLNNGEPKIFRSPTEGNFLVYLMNVSLNPENSLGRMLHSFNCSAVEMGEYETPVLEYYGLIDASETLKTQTRWQTIDIYNSTVEYKEITMPGIYQGTAYVLNEDTGEYYITPIDQSAIMAGVAPKYYEKDVSQKESMEFKQLNNTDVYSVSFIDMMPGSKIMVGDEVIQIGATGAYFFESEKPISYIGVQKSSTVQGTCTYAYQTNAGNIFNNIREASIIDVPIRQIIGDGYKEVEFPYHNPNEKEVFKSNNILDIIQDSKHELLNINFIRGWKRPLQEIYIKRSDARYLETNPNRVSRFYEDMTCSEQSRLSGTFKEDLYIYPIRLERGDYRRELENGDVFPYLFEGYYVNAMSYESNFSPYSGYAIDGLTGEIFKVDDDLFKFYLNDEPIELNEKERYYLDVTDTIDYIESNRGVLLELSYCTQFKTYAFEFENLKVKRLKEEYEALQTKLLADRSQGILIEQWNGYDPYIDRLQAVIDKYHEFITALNRVIIKYKEDNGLEL